MLPVRVEPPRARALRGAEKAWVEEESRAQERRYRRIARAMEALEHRRQRWIADFFKRIQTRGWSFNNGYRIRIAAKDIPARPKRKLRVVF